MLFKYEEKSKIAAVELEEDTTQWPRQVLVELYRTLPDTADYSPEVKFLQLDEEQGFGLGVVILSGATNSALAAQAATSAKKALVPVVIKNHSLCPMDLLMTAKGKMLPLTAERLREALYRPETFDLLTQDWDDTQLWSMFYPPGRGDNAFGSGTANNASTFLQGSGMGKSAGASFELLEALSGTIFEHDVNAITKAMHEPSMFKAASKNSTFLAAMKRLSESTLVGAKLASDYEDAVASLYPAQVLQLSYGGNDKYVVKTANRDHPQISEHVMDRGAFLKLAGDALTKRVDTEGTVTVSEAVKVVAGPNGQQINVIDCAGRYAVFSASTGETLEGWVFPELIDAAGNKNPIALFTNGKVSALQEQIAGGHSYGGCDLVWDRPAGTGCFVTTGGDEQVTVPMAVHGAVRGNDGEISYDCTDFLGGKCKVTLHPGTKGVVALPSRRELLMPADTRFIRTDGASAPPLVATGSPGRRLQEATEGGGKLAHLAFYGENSYGLREAPEGLCKLAHWSPDMDHDATMWALCLGGLSAPQAAATLLEAEKRGSASVLLHELTIDHEAQESVKKAAHERTSEIHALRCDLLKEAALLPDVMSVDAVLGLGFINSENVETFVARLPYLEKALSGVCELLLASRLGVTEIPESASARCIKSLNDVTQGLKALALKEIRGVS